MNQHHKPCKTCPFSRTSTPGELGGSSVETYIGQAVGAFWIPCHECVDYSDPNWRYQYKASQCAGLAIYRANCHPAIRPDTLLSLPPDKELVFSEPAEFIAHHYYIPVEAARAALEVITPERLLEIEMKRSGAEYINEQELK